MICREVESRLMPLITNHEARGGDRGRFGGDAAVATLQASIVAREADGLISRFSTAVHEAKDRDCRSVFPVRQRGPMPGARRQAPEVGLWNTIDTTVSKGLLHVRTESALAASAPRTEKAWIVRNVASGNVL